jgi:hypothetical protein
MITDNEDDSKATSPKQPKIRIRTRSMVKEEKKFQEKDKIFSTYEKKSRQRQQAKKKQALKNNDEAQQKHYEYIQSLEGQEESPAGEIGQHDEEVNIISEHQTVEESMEIDVQTIEKTPTNREEQDNEDADIISPIFEQQIIEKDEDATLISLVFKQQVTKKDEDATIISPVFEKQVT